MNRPILPVPARRRLLGAVALLAAGTGWPALSAAVPPAATRIAAGDPAAVDAPAAPPAAPAVTEPPRVVLLLPPKGSPFARAAGALRAGFQAAHDRDGRPMALEIVEAGDEAEALRALWRDFAAKGVSLVVGPLTRSGVTALADLGEPPVPTLALNQPEGGDRRLPNLLLFGLPIEAEARQAALLAWAQRGAGAARPRAAVLGTPSPLSRRAAQAFQDAWRELGGDIDLVADLDARQSVAETRLALSGLNADVLFLAGGNEQARPLRLALASLAAVPPGTAPTEIVSTEGVGSAASRGTAGAAGTSAASGEAAPFRPPLLVGTTQLVVGVNGSGVRAPELDGIRLVEMPWIAQASPAGDLSRPGGPLAHVELQRLYAMGADACRIAQQLARRATAFEMDGVTGRLAFDATKSLRVQRAGLPAEFKGGVPVPMER